MAKLEKKSPNQLSLLDLIRQQAQAPSSAMGALDIDSELRAALAEDIKACPLSRYQIAARMSELLNTEITKAMIDHWTAESHALHRMPAGYLAAFAVATTGRRAVETVARHAGLFALPGPEALGAEIQRIDEQIKRLKEQKRSRLALQRELERRR